MAKAGESLRGMADLARQLRGKRVAFIGDSLTQQFLKALECAAMRERRTVGRMVTIKVAVQAPELAFACRSLWKAVVRGRGATAVGVCTCKVTEHESWVDSQCRALKVPRDAARALEVNSSAEVELPAFWLPRLNLTWMPRFGDLFRAQRSCPVCVRAASVAADAGVSRQPRPTCRTVDFCASQPLPSHVALAKQAGADVVVYNFGLWHHTFSDYRAAVDAALRELDAFGRLPGKVAVFRETSAQHFDAPTGDYDDALRRDPALVLLNATAELPSDAGGGARKWVGPSMCRQGPASASPARGWRNEVMHETIRRLGLEHVFVQPFEEITRERWDYHASAVWNSARRRWASDCTHFCYSPVFWELSAHQLFNTLAKAGLPRS